MTKVAKKANPASEALQKRERTQAEAMGLGLLSLLRRIEQNGPAKPRIGRNQRLRDALVRLGQDPFLSFPASDLSQLDTTDKAPRIRAQFLGFYGAFGALPLNMTAEVKSWFDVGDEAFANFTNIFTARFQELFFRAWSDSHALTQFDHPHDQFQTYLLSLMGVGTQAFRERTCLPDIALARISPLAIGRVKSPVRLRQMLEVHFNHETTFEVEEFVISWLSFQPSEFSRLGQQSASLGQDVHLGSRVSSCIDKVRLHIHVPTIEKYYRFIPGGVDFCEMRDIVFWYLGNTFDIDVVLWLPEPQVQSAVLGESAQLAWMACLAPDSGNPDHQITATQFKLEAKTSDANPIKQIRAA